jgi:DNA-binding NtrC family response regulator
VLRLRSRDEIASADAGWLRARHHFAIGPYGNPAHKPANLQLQYAWPGNVRELENALERAVALAPSDRIGADDLPTEVGAAQPAVRDRDDVRTLAEVERPTSRPPFAPQPATAPRRQRGWALDLRRCTGSSSRRGREPAVP